MAQTHFSSLQSKKRVLFDAPPAEPQAGDFYWDNKNNRWCVYVVNAGENYTGWVFAQATTTTSTSTSTTTTSTSTTTTSTSTSTSTSTTTSTSTSTTTTL